MKPRELPSQAMLHLLFDYKAETGELIWRFREAADFPDDAPRKTFNAKYAGKVAVTPVKQGKADIYYVVVKINFVGHYAHRLIWKYVTGVDPVVVDHEDHNGLNNRFSNLRNVSNEVNCQNGRLRRTNTSGATGVHFRRGRWVATIFCRSKRKHIGQFGTFEEALAARLAAEKKFGFHPSHGKHKA